MSPAVLLDTCAVIWLANGDALREAALAAIMHAALAEGVFISPVSAWEIGMLARPRGDRPAMRFHPDPATWFARVMAGPATKTATLTGEIAIAASHLPGPLHGDPADRLLLATARDLAMPIVTRDARILDYAAAGHVAAISC
jgi:PIN domain nuclease of toxin-antitoxin system